MTIATEPTEKHCQDCASWVKLSDQDGGIGICDSAVSNHNQHIVGHWHPACDMMIEATDVALRRSRRES
jgi:hypothetical protein